MEAKQTSKPCFKCGADKPLSDFYIRKSAKDGLAGECKLCSKARKASWLKSNAEHDRARQKKVREKNRDAKRAYDKLYKAKIIESERIRGRVKQARRRAAQKKATPSWASQDAIAEIYLRDAALSESTGISHDVDHIVPLVSPIVCGLHCEANLRPIPSLPNRSKGNRYWPDMP